MSVFQSITLSERVLEILSMLTVLEGDVYTTFLETLWVIPALISFSARTSRLVFEEDDEYLASSVEHQVK